MKLDTHLYNLVAQFIQAEENSAEEQRLYRLGLDHLQARSPNLSLTSIRRTWAVLTDALSLEDGE